MYQLVVYKETMIQLVNLGKDPSPLKVYDQARAYGLLMSILEMIYSRDKCKALCGLVKV